VLVSRLPFMPIESMPAAPNLPARANGWYRQGKWNKFCSTHGSEPLPTHVQNGTAPVVLPRVHPRQALLDPTPRNIVKVAALEGGFVLPERMIRVSAFVPKKEHTNRVFVIVTGFCVKATVAARCRVGICDGPRCHDYWTFRTASRIFAATDARRIILFATKSLSRTWKTVEGGREPPSGSLIAPAAPLFGSGGMVPTL
jgi:hypothetical protein